MKDEAWVQQEARRLCDKHGASGGIPWAIAMVEAAIRAGLAHRTQQVVERLLPWAKRAADELQLEVDGMGHDDDGNPECQECGRELPEDHGDDPKLHDENCAVARRCVLLHEHDTIAAEFGVKDSENK